VLLSGKTLCAIHAEAGTTSLNQAALIDAFISRGLQS
jgi:hypothetical protein